MNKTLVCGAVSAVLLCTLATSAARSQSAAANVARAQQTLGEIERLIDGMHARAAGGGTGEPAKMATGSLFDGATLAGWKPTDFRGAGAVRVDPRFRGGTPAIVVDAGSALTGITWTGKDSIPKTNYEISLESMKIDGLDFMCGLTFPVDSSYATLILGGWGGNVVGISSIEGQDASENETSRGMEFAKDHWYAVRMRVTPARLEAWLDDKKIVDVNIAGKKIGLRFGEISKSAPLGLASYQTKAAWRNIRLRELGGPQQAAGNRL
ncbi:MAG TPA: DUF1080 domain-containing protein [Chthonomonadaceae bacterium]|nr:DUF1080 domain-containing protein [Chthonomonadaceae bacterium]